MYDTADRTFTGILTSSGWRASLLISISISLMLSPSLPHVRGDTCVFYSDITFSQYIMFPNSNMLMGSFKIYTDNQCVDEVSEYSTPDMGYVLKNSQSEAQEYCSSMHNKNLHAHRDYTKYNSQNIWYCLDPTTLSQRFNSDSSGSGSGRSGGPSDSDGSGDGIIHSCEQLVQNSVISMTALYGLGSGIQCTRVSPASIDNSAVQSQGVQDAIDVWGYAEQGYELCYPRLGKIIFLDASTSPRTVVNVDHRHNNGFTCASLNRSGTVVLAAASLVVAAQSLSQPVSRQARGITPGTDDSIDSAISLTGCTVTPTTTLKLRTTPWGAWLGQAWQGQPVSASARTRSWFKISYAGQDGWIAAWLTIAEANGCNGSGPGYTAYPLSSSLGRYAALVTGA